MNGKMDQDHLKKRAILRTVGPIVLIIGIIFLIIGIADFFSVPKSPFGGSISQTPFGGSNDFFSSTQNFGGGPDLFWCFFIAFPLIAIGIGMTSAGYMGAMARYQANEIAPVGKDVFNYMADGTSEGVKNISKAIHSGVTESKNGIRKNEISKNVKCTHCSTPNTDNAKFCNNCGQKIRLISTCYSCGQENDVNAKFCNHCGSSLI
ncbi:double zinc ribbon protein [Natranaerovirga pectinivora]|uniref:Double zinc ribbon protein n=1 Tax=Natranaerovirga pectinivora TaxID=682400 RepID=A0A4V6NZV3_9FIRM|nr:zinc ribbon domain-containing protein [Natranaerovirga pectinivora]TCT17159.1 double zinc ribbon protein [Natranaerovirga pectinivora]